MRTAIVHWPTLLGIIIGGTSPETIVPIGGTVLQTVVLTKKTILLRESDEDEKKSSEEKAVDKANALFSSDSDTTRRCKRCHTFFPSRNALFRHLESCVKTLQPPGSEPAFVAAEITSGSEGKEDQILPKIRKAPFRLYDPDKVAESSGNNYTYLQVTTRAQPKGDNITACVDTRFPDTFYVNQLLSMTPAIKSVVTDVKLEITDVIELMEHHGIPFEADPGTPNANLSYIANVINATQCDVPTNLAEVIDPFDALAAMDDPQPPDLNNLYKPRIVEVPSIFGIKKSTESNEV
ncbi:hypothetical protein F5Y14DRAFT_463502 [Nemania sp. NC0429]|nr:hypothetical protein F5Y14DRAFT_463502 [Nemania sp. NC0429]